MGRHANHLHKLLQHSAWARAGERGCCDLRGIDCCFDRTSAAIGGGYYPRSLSELPHARLYRVRKLRGAGEFATVTQALAQWTADKGGIAGPLSAIIEIADSGTYHEAPVFRLEAGEELQLRAASMTRPVLRMFDYRSGAPECIVISAGPASRFAIDGLMVAGGPLSIEAAPAAQGQLACQVTLRHCTLVPGWHTEAGNVTAWRGKQSLTLGPGAVTLRLDHSITGALTLHADLSDTGARQLQVSDSIVDGGHPAALAIADQACGPALIHATFQRSTIVGVVQVEELQLAASTIFLGVLLSARCERGRIRHCYVPPGSRTPPRTHCQPVSDVRVQPRFVSLDYGRPGYGMLAPDCAPEIAHGAEEGNQMGAFHDLHRAPLVLGAATVTSG